MNWWMDVCNSVYGGGIFCALIMIGLNFFVIVGTNSAGSRLAWSMARDKAFPYSEYFAHVSKRFHIPLRAMIAILVIDLVIGELLPGVLRRAQEHHANVMTQVSSSWAVILPSSLSSLAEA